MENKLKKYKIYSIRSYNDKSVIYYDYTTQFLHKRLSAIKSRYTRYLNNMDNYIVSFELFKLGNVYIELEEELECINREHLNVVLNKYIRDNEIRNVAAIASLEASKIYTLQILETSIQTIKNNKTRFVILEKIKKNKPDFDKAALKFILDHKRGSLATVLNMMSDCNLNLTKIQSLPVIQTPGKYAFFVDITFKSIENYKKAIKIIELMAQEFKILGEYKYQKS